MAQVYLVTGASTGFGRLIAQKLAKSGYTVFAGMYMHDGNIQPYVDEVDRFAAEQGADLRAVPLDLLDESSIAAAVQDILTRAGRLDAVVHNAGHMGYGFAEAFTAAQFLRMYEVNVVGCQRLNQAVLPHMRARRAGHLIWISSGSAYGGKSPLLAPYFAAKAAQDSLAQSYAKELTAWGIETTIALPGLFATGTNHFQDAARPALVEVSQQYEDGPTKGLAELVTKGTMAVPPPDADPSLVANAIVALAAVPRGQKPFRISIDPSKDGSDVAAAAVDQNAENFYQRMGIEKYWKVWL